MATTDRTKLMWLGFGLVLGYAVAFLQKSLALWPFHEDSAFIFLRWLGKVGIKVLLAAVLIVMVVLVLNLLFGWLMVVRERRHKRSQ